MIWWCHLGEKVPTKLRNDINVMSQDIVSFLILVGTGATCNAKRSTVDQ